MNWTKEKLVKKLKEVRVNFIKYRIDKTLQQHGHSVLRLPPYHPDLNSIEVVWGVLKRRVAAENVVQNRKSVEQLIQQHFSDSSADLWRNCCERTLRNEQQYLAQSLEVAIEIEVADIGEEVLSGNDSLTEESSEEYETEQEKDEDIRVEDVTHESNSTSTLTASEEDDDYDFEQILTGTKILKQPATFK